MSFCAYLNLLLFQLVLFSQNAQPVPTFSSQPSSSTVEEGQNLILQWSYNLDGQSLLAAQFTNTTDGTSGAPTVAAKQAKANITVSSGYEQHFSAAISDTQAKLTILAAPRSINGNKYQFKIVTGFPNFFNLASDEVEISVLYAPYITDISNQTFNEGDLVTQDDLNCATDGNPPPNINWTRLSNDSVVIFPLTISRQDEGGYNCTADNGIGSPANGVAFITVHYKPENVQLVTNATANKACQGDTLKFTCSADGKPVVHTYQLFENEVPCESGSSGMWIKTLSNNGDLPNQTYKCVANNTVGTVNSQNVSIFVGVPSSIQMIQNEVVTEGGDLNLSCIASGTPSPLVSWINSSGHRHNGNVLELTNITRREAGEYICEASNECGNSSEAVNTNVQYPPQITKPQTPTRSIYFAESASIECLAEGNPQPHYKWTKAAGVVITTDKRLRLDNVDDSDGGNYTCTATNALNFDSFTIFVKVTKRRIRLEVTVEKLNGVEAVYQRDYEDLNSEPAKTFKEKFEKEMDKVYANDPSYNTTVVTGLREGSVIVSFVLYYKTAVSLNEGLAKLRFAAEKGNIGPYTVGCLKIIQDVNPTSTPVLPTGSTASVIPKGNTTPSSSECECSCNDAILGAVIGILIFIIILLIIYIVWQRRKGATGNNRPREVHLKDAGFYDNEIPMEDVEPNNFRPSNSTQQATFPGPTYMGLQEATRSGNDPTDQTVPSTLQVQRPSQSADYAPLHPSTRSWEVARDLVTIEKVIGKGAFGQVAKGTAINLRGRPGKTTVAVKMLKATAPESDRKDLLSELEVMKTLKPHRHVIKLLGCVTESEPLLVLIEYVPYGDLLGYLRKSRGLNDTYYKDPDIKPQTSLTSQQLMKFAWQIADGMSYLSSRSIIHRDLAARNVLVGEKEICKVTDFGMARDVQQENIYERKTKGRLPVKWTAYEALLFGTYTTKSDIWSYGVVLYEICTIGGSPYPRMDGRKIANMLQEGYRMPKPQHVDDKLYQIMMNCWQNEPQARPSFTALTKQLKDMENQHKKLINMHIYDNQLYAKVEDLNV